MKLAKTSARLLTSGLALLGILAACDLNDSPQHADTPVSASFAPRILAPAGGLRPSDWLVLDVWTQNQTGDWVFLLREDSIAPNQLRVEVSVPLSTKLRYRLAGYVTTFVAGVPRIDTTWSAVDENFIIYPNDPVSTRSSLAVASNWAIPVSSPVASSATFTPGNAVTFKAPANQRIVVGATSALSCATATAKDTVATIKALLQSPLQVWVLACGQDETTHPSSPQLFSWNVDTSGSGAVHTPSQPVPAGTAGFVSGGLLTTAQAAPTSPILLSGSETSYLAWNLRVDDTPVAPLDSSAFPSTPSGLAGADHVVLGGTMDVWAVAKDLLPTYPRGMRILVTAVRIDTSLGVEWVSSPLRFWYPVVPPEHSRFTLRESGWDSVSASWDLSVPNLLYKAWFAIGDSSVDITRFAPIDTGILGAGTFGLGNLPADSPITFLRTVTDPTTGLSTSARSTVRTRALPALPTPFLIWPTSNGVPIKNSQESEIQAGSPTDSAGRTLRLRYAYSAQATNLVTNPADGPWPDLSTAPILRADASGHLAIDVAAGNTVFVTIASEDPSGNLSIAQHLHFQIVDDAVVLPPPAPGGLTLVARTPNSLQFRWNKVPGCRYRLKYTRTIGAIEDDVSDSSFTITGLTPSELVADIAVKAIDTANASRASEYSFSLSSARTKSPPEAPVAIEMGWQWNTSLSKPFVSWSWARQASAVDEVVFAFQADSGVVPTTASWSPRPLSSQSTDTFSISYPAVPAGTRYIGFGLRSTRDTITSTENWVWQRVPLEAPALTAANVRVWQFGNTWRIRLLGTTVPTGFKLSIKVGTAASGPTIDFPGGTADIELTPFGAGVHQLAVSLRRIDPLGVPPFDAGTALLVTKLILPPPSGFNLYPSSRDNQWIFTAPSDLAANGIPHLVRPSLTPTVPVRLASGETIDLDPDKPDSIFLVQIADGDTSALSPGRTVGRVTAMPQVSPGPGSYLFPFPVSISGRNPQILSSEGLWTSAGSLLYPSSSKWSFSLRTTDDFLVGTPQTYTYLFDSTFEDEIWGKRLDESRGSGRGIGEALVAWSGGEATWKPTDGTTSSSIILSGGLLGTPIRLGFLVNPVKEGTIDAAGSPGLVLRGAFDASGTTNYSIQIGVQTDSGIMVLTFPVEVGTGMLDKYQIVVPFSALYSSSYPTINSLLATETPKKLSWASAIPLLKRTSWIALSASSTLATRTPSFELSSLALEPQGTRLP